MVFAEAERCLGPNSEARNPPPCRSNARPAIKITPPTTPPIIGPSGNLFSESVPVAFAAAAVPEDADAVEETDEDGVILGEVIPPGEGVGPEGGIGPLIVEQELPNKVLETMARPSANMVATTRSVTVSMKEACIVNSMINILAITAPTDNRDLRSCGKVSDASSAVNGAGCRIDTGVGNSSKRR